MTINGVILTDNAIEQLRRFQDEDNSLLKNSIELLMEINKNIINDACINASDAKAALSVASGLFAIGDQMRMLFATEGGAA